MFVALFTCAAVLTFACNEASGREADLGEDRCGPLSLAVCFRHFGESVSVDSLVNLTGNKGQETSLADLKSAALQVGAKAVCLRWHNAAPPFIPTKAAAVLPVFVRGQPHFVAALACTKEKLLINDFGNAIAWVPYQQMFDDLRWDGTMLYIFQDQDSGNALNAALEGWTQYGAFALLISGILAFFRSLPADPARRQRQSVEHRQLRQGFTLVEMLVSLGLISILLSLLLPSVQSARESARQVVCINNLRQVGTAIASAEATQQRIPPAGRFFPDKRTRNTKAVNRSIHVGLLPFLEQSALFDRYHRLDSGWGILSDPPYSESNGELLQIRLPIFLCPSDPSPILRNSYRICAGTSPGLHETTNEPPSNQALRGFMWMTGFRDPQIVDGRSNTAAFSERVGGDGNSASYSSWTDIRTLSVKTRALKTPSDVQDACQLMSLRNPSHVSYAGFTWVLNGYSQTTYNHILGPNSDVSDCIDGGPESNGAYSARSYHIDHVNILLADGSVRQISNTVSVSVWRAIATVRGSEATSEF